MDLSDDLPPQRRPLFFPVVIATTFLSIIGMSIGLLLGANRDDAVSRTGSQQQQNPVDVPAGDQPTTKPPPTGPECRAETEQAAKRTGVDGPLYQVLRVRTEGSVVYICEDGNGSLFYHANNGGNDWIEGKTALFLSGVEDRGGEYHVTSTDGATFAVSRDWLKIVKKDGTPEEQKVIEAD